MHQALTCTRTARSIPVSALVLSLLGCIRLAGCERLEDEDGGTVAKSEIPYPRQGTIKTRLGYVDDKKVQLYCFGTFVPSDESWFPAYDTFPGMPVGEMYVWAGKDGKPSLEQEQRPIIDTLPYQAGYSDFFEIVKVTPTEELQANAIKSRGTLLLADFTLERTGLVVNCPVVGEKAALEATYDKVPYRAAFKGKMTLWYRGKTAHCMLMEGSAAFDAKGAPGPLVFSGKVGSRNEHRVAINDLYTMITKAFIGGDQVSSIPVPENEIFRYGPDSVRYSPLAKVWDVTVPSDYQVGQINSYSDLYPVPDFTDPRIVKRNPEAFANCSLATSPR